MPKQPSPSVVYPAAVGHGDVTRLLGDVDDAKIAGILALRPSLVELEQAATWIGGNGDVLARKGHRLAGIVADIVEILATDEEDDEPPPASS